MKVATFCALGALLALGCGRTYPLSTPVGDASSSAGGRAGGGGGGAGGATVIANGGAPPQTISADLRLDHFGYRPDESKIAVVLGASQVDAELRLAQGDGIVARFTSGASATDEDSGDQYSVIDFSSFKTAGKFYIDVPSKNYRSYEFEIRDDVDDIVGIAAVRSYYFQRCNHDKALPYAGDAVGAYTGLGGKWVDAECHTQDRSLGAGPGSANAGTLDLQGGWHDAGDYQKTLWDRGVEHLLFAYELNPGVWKDGQLNLPESGNGVPDLLDEIRWELDFYVRMLRTDGHFLSSVKGNNATVVSPPSASDEQRVYFDGTSPSGNGWSGGGVTTFEATANGTRALAHAAVVFGAAGQSSVASGYRAAALRGWAWLSGKTPGNAAERRLELAAAAAVWRLDSTQTSAATFVKSFAWSTWDGLLPYSVTPAESVITVAAWNTLLNSAADSTLLATIRAAAGRVVISRDWEQRGVYGGMFGSASGGWDFSWGSNRNASMYGANLLAAVHFGILAGHTEAEVRTQGLAYLHYMLGLNPKAMVYLTNMAAYGGEHSSFQLYHGWFSYTGGDGDHGSATYNGKPKSVVEPLYPYYVDDSQTSTYGPAPGLVPGGPNFGYSGTYVIPDRAYPAYAYRDWSVGCGWDGSKCASASWEITEPDVGYQGAFVFLVSFAMSAK